MKLTTWNIEHLRKPLMDSSNPDNFKRLSLIAQEITQINPDVLCIIEAPGDPSLIQNWIDLPFGNGGLGGEYVVATIEGTHDLIKSKPNNPRGAIQSLYAMKGTITTGDQWIWFLIRRTIYNSCFIGVQDPKVWHGLTGQKQWPVNYWGEYTSSKTEHWRHPQVLMLKLNSFEIEIIGVHLKSKINMKTPFDKVTKELTKQYVDEALKARIRLATEAYDVRMYIEQRFQQEPNPRIIVCGDLNDGPGREFFERQFLFFDLISNIQGEVFFADRFLNHALFDFKDELRWTTNFDDKVERWALQNLSTYKMPTTKIDTTRKQLIDHILFTQAFVNKSKGPKVLAHSGLVEHTIHEKINAGNPKKIRTSDHRPVSVVISDV